MRGDHRKTGMLASVTSIAEAKLAFSAGADIIDLKDPTGGALGALPLETIVKIVTWVGGRKPVSATIGDLVNNVQEQLGRSVEAVAATGVDYVKVGVFPGIDTDTFIATLSSLARGGVAIVVVLFGDAGWPPAFISELAGSGIAGVMLDTASKGGRSLRHYVTEKAMDNFLREAGSHGWITGLAGSLTVQDIPHLLPLAPDYLGFRGALCDEQNRNLGLDPAALARVCSAMLAKQPIRAQAEG